MCTLSLFSCLPTRESEREDMREMQSVRKKRPPRRRVIARNVLTIAFKHTYIIRNGRLLGDGACSIITGISARGVTGKCVFFARCYCITQRFVQVPRARAWVERARKHFARARALRRNGASVGYGGRARRTSERALRARKIESKLAAKRPERWRCINKISGFLGQEEIHDF